MLLDPRDGTPRATFDVGGTPTSVAVGEGAAWVLNADDQTISRIDARTRAVKTFGSGGVPRGLLRTGDEVLVLPSEKVTRIARIDTFDGPLDEACAGMSVTLLLEDEIDISRGDIICHPGDAPQLAREFEATVCWMADAPLRAGTRYAVKHATHAARVVVDEGPRPRRRPHPHTGR